MTKKLVIVESPAKAKTIAKFLGSGFKVHASMGHVRDLPKSSIGIEIDEDFQPKYITIRGKGDIIKELRKEASKTDKVYLATDPDREGEAISWHLAHLLKLSEKERCRIEFNEITKTAIKNAIKNPREINMNLVNAQQARRILDRLVGYKISPLLWKKVSKGLSAGRVQSVATKMICDREAEITNFKPEEYWSLLLDLLHLDTKAVFQASFYGDKTNKIKLTNKEQVDDIIKSLKDKECIVESIVKKEKLRNAPPPFITSNLQQEASRRLGFPTRKTMIVAQQLYEGLNIKGKGSMGLITYIRTDSFRISDEARENAKKLIVKEYGEEFYPNKPNIFKSKKGSQDAHEAIRPSSLELEPNSIKDSISKDQYRLYKLIYERFIASQMAPAVYDTVMVKISAGKYVFNLSGSKIKFLGFLSVYKYGDDESNEFENKQIPNLEKGDRLKIKKLNPKQHFTQPPSRYTEATLVKAMEDEGIGRPSTYAPTIATIIARRYIAREGKLLKPTELGEIVNEIMKEFFKDIVDLEFTADMEQKLDDVEEGEKQWVDVLRNFYSPFDDALKNAEEQIGDIKIEDEKTDIICEKCGRNMVIKHGRYGDFIACPGFPECRNTKPIVNELDVACPECKGNIVVKKTKKGRQFYGCSNYPECQFVSWNEPTDKRCEKCKGVLVKKKSKKSEENLVCINDKCDKSK